MTRVTLAFLGQCHTTGYAGVPADVAFPAVLRRVLESSRPGVSVDLVLEQFQHPSELPSAVARALRARPRVVVIEVIGWLAIKGSGAVNLTRLPRGIRSAYDRMRHFRHVSGQLLAKAPRASALVQTVQADAYGIASGLLGPLLPRYPRPTIEEYEDFVNQALNAVAECPGMAAVVQGPAAPNLDLDLRGLASDAVERYAAVRQMAERVAAAHSALYVDRWDTVTSGFFLPGSIRPTREGHSVFGHLLAERLLEAGLI